MLWLPLPSHFSLRGSGTPEPPSYSISLSAHCVTGGEHLIHSLAIPLARNSGLTVLASRSLLRHYAFVKAYHIRRA